MNECIPNNDYIQQIKHEMQRDQFLLKCQYAIDIMEAKCKIIAEELSIEKNRKIVKTICHRIKSPQSIYTKLVEKKLTPCFQSAVETINDIIGVRIICIYQDDLYEFAHHLTSQKDITVVNSKDYIKHPKKSGYRSLHLILDVPICLNTNTENKRIEVQLRTVPMDCWSVLDYQLCYKNSDRDINNVKEKLKKHSKIIEELDQEMMLLRNEIEQIT